ncbi:MAG: thiol-disulfide oxidoreductase DCC family protein [Nonlabens sp.]
MNTDKDIILFDGVCNLCNGAVNFIIDRDRADHFRFAALRSPVGLELLDRHGIDPDHIDSIVLVSGNSAFAKAEAAVKIARRLDGGWKLLYLLNILPDLLKNPVYEFIARNRYKWFGEKESCVLPTPEKKAKFLENGTY